MSIDRTEPGGRSGIDWNEVHQRMEKARAALDKLSWASPAEEEAILKRRALALAQKPGRAASLETSFSLVVFRLSQETYGIESEFVAEVCPLKDLTLLPGMPPFVTGIVNIRGKILSVVDLKKFFNLPEIGLGDLNKIIVLRNETMEFGILADVILDIRFLEFDAVQAAPQTITGIGAAYLKGVTKEGVILLDANGILNDEKMIVNETVNEK